MKRLRIEHVTGFSYEEEANASYNEARMLPKSVNNQSVLGSNLSIEPSTSINYFQDYFGTHVASFEVLQPHATLNISANSLVEVRVRPHDRTGITWDQLMRETARSVETAEMLADTNRTRPHQEVVDLAREIAARSTGPEATARDISCAVRERIEYMHGVTEVHSTAADAWEARKGVCQDFAHITIGALREVGIPARYVSGYLHPHEDAEIGEPVIGESHAWVEWFTGRWQGFDPTNGNEIGDRHVFVGTGRNYTDVPPLRGVYDGPSTSSLHVKVTITREA